MKNDKVYLTHINEAIETIEEYLSGDKGNPLHFLFLVIPAKAGIHYYDI